MQETTFKSTSAKLLVYKTTQTHKTPNQLISVRHVGLSPAACRIVCVNAPYVACVSTLSDCHLFIQRVNSIVMAYMVLDLSVVPVALHYLMTPMQTLMVWSVYAFSPFDVSKWRSRKWYILQYSAMLTVKLHNIKIDCCRTDIPYTNI